jgi:hypothetical protein
LDIDFGYFIAKVISGSAGMVDILTVEGNLKMVSSQVRERAIETLEQGGVIFLPDLSFGMHNHERAFLDRVSSRSRVSILDGRV